MITLDRRIRTSLFAIGADIVLTVIKAVLAFFTGSAALLADAYHSASDFIVSLILLCGLVIKQRAEKTGSDRAILRAKHIESVLAIAVALIILYIPVEIIADIRSNSDAALQIVWIGIIGMLVVIAVVFFMAKLKTYVGKETDSMALEADGQHSNVDLFTSIAVLLSLIGYMIGVNIDALVAILIAIMIALSGLELLVSGIRSLVKGTEFDQLSLLELGATLYQKLPLNRVIKNAVTASIRGVVKHRLLVCGALLVSYFATGITIVQYGDIGIKSTFARPAAQVLQPGLHYALPWPLAQIDERPTGEVWQVTVGSSHFVAQDEQRLWREIKETRVLNDPAQYLVTGDEQLLDINLNVQYRYANVRTHYFAANDIAALIQHQLESSLWQITGHMTMAQVIAMSQTQFVDNVVAHAQSQLTASGVEVDIVDAQLLSLQPPAMVVSAYRDVQTAVQEQQQRVNRAVALRSENIPLARASVATQHAEAKAMATEITYAAQADVAKKHAEGQVYAAYPNAMRYEQHIKAIANGLENKPLIIISPNIAKEDIRNWQITQPN
jgi:membrane protease subunit HflK